MRKTWHDTSGRKRHLIAELTDGETLLIASKYYYRSLGWHFVLEEKIYVEMYIDMIKKMKQ